MSRITDLLAAPELRGLTIPADESAAVASAGTRALVATLARCCVASRRWARGHIRSYRRTRTQTTYRDAAAILLLMHRWG
jgi:hypothetical protein